LSVGLLAVEVVADGEVSLLDVAEFLGEVNLASLVVVVE
jgi:malonyl CoA-acyl carrier protein transacylase